MSIDLARAALDHDSDRFRQLAEELGWGWCAALLGTLTDDERAALKLWADEWWARPELELLRDWLLETPAALWAFTEACATRLMGDDGRRWPRPSWVASNTWGFVRTVCADRTELPWLNMELLGALDSSRRTLINNLTGFLWGPHDPAPLLHTLRTRKITARRDIAAALNRGNLLDDDLLLGMLLDPPLRPLAVEALQAHMPRLVEQVRPLTKHRSKAVRAAAFEVVRAVEPTAAPAGTDMDVAELEAILREEPWHQEASQVWADRLLQLGDPRGQLVALEHAIRRAAPEEALRLSAEQAAWAEDNRVALIGRPGGFPFRTTWRGRRAIRYGSAWNNTARGKGGLALLERVERFLDGVTRSDQPVALEVGTRTHRNAIARGDIAAQLAQGRRVYVSSRFGWVHPGTDIALPHQEAGHHPGGEPLHSTLTVELQNKQLGLSLTFPFEDFEDPFLTFHDACTNLLGKVFAPSGWALLHPKADGQGLKSRGQRFKRKGFVWNPSAPIPFR